MIRMAIRTDFAEDIFSRYLHDTIQLLPLNLIFRQEEGQYEEASPAPHYETYLQNITEITQNTSEELIVNLRLDMHFMNQMLSRTLPSIHVPKNMQSILKKDPAKILDISSVRPEAEKTVKNVLQQEASEIQQLQSKAEHTAMHPAQYENNAQLPQAPFMEAPRVLAEPVIREGQGQKPAVPAQTKANINLLNKQEVSGLPNASLTEHKVLGRIRPQAESKSASSAERSAALKASDTAHADQELPDYKMSGRTQQADAHKRNSVMQPFPTAENLMQKNSGGKKQMIRFPEAPHVLAETPSADSSEHNRETAVNVPTQGTAEVVPHSFPKAEELLKKNAAQESDQGRWFPAAPHALAPQSNEPDSAYVGYRKTGDGLHRPYSHVKPAASLKPAKSQSRPVPHPDEPQISQMSLMLKANGYLVQNRLFPKADAFVQKAISAAENAPETPIQQAQMQLLSSDAVKPEAGQGKPADVHPVLRRELYHSNSHKQTDSHKQSRITANHPVPQPASGRQQAWTDRTEHTSVHPVSLVHSVLDAGAVDQFIQDASTSRMMPEAERIIREQLVLPAENSKSKTLTDIRTVTKTLLRNQLQPLKSGKINSTQKFSDAEMPLVPPQTMEQPAAENSAAVSLQRLTPERPSGKKVHQAARMVQPVQTMLQHLPQYQEEKAPQKLLMPQTQMAVDAVRALPQREPPAPAANVVRVPEPVIIYRKEESAAQDNAEEKSTAEVADIQTIRKVVRRETSPKKQTVRAINEPESVNTAPITIPSAKISDAEVHKLADRVYNLLEKRLRFEQQRRGGF